MARALNSDAVGGIRTVDLTKRYRSGESEFAVFEGLNLAVSQGERVAVIGESGAGKSTLLHLLGGLDRPTSGRILHGELDIAHLDENGLADFRNRQIGFVWQIHYLLPEFTALENVMMPLLIRGVSPGSGGRLPLARLEEVGLRPRATHRAGELSGGEQQRVVLARALVGKARVSARRRADRQSRLPDRGPDLRPARRFASIAPPDVHFRHSQSPVRAALRPGLEVRAGSFGARRSQWFAR